ncbi:NF-kappa-B essential modulator-like isoform X2 [Lethenteron reissneri]|uniref:NF-kappa-B essential modulator-like isoform X2 n=1 Tax=Lethenteron reissneri TaxID=7753 RepID=UPI002AB7331B|nr:NF-kappa-B essential modulator-like isoform X2 [Lethenteron reissneri]
MSMEHERPPHLQMNGAHAMGSSPVDAQGPLRMGPASCSGPPPSSLFSPEETVQQIRDLLRENDELRNAVKTMTQTMQQQYTDIMAWRDGLQKEKEFAVAKFTEARISVERLTTECDGYKRKLLQAERQLRGGEEDNDEEGARAEAPGGEQTEYVVLLRNQKEHLEGEVHHLKEQLHKMMQEKAEVVALNNELQLQASADVTDGESSPRADESYVEIREVEGYMVEQPSRRGKHLNPESSSSSSIAAPLEEGRTYSSSTELTVSRLLLQLQEMTKQRQEVDELLRKSERSKAELELRLSEAESRLADAVAETAALRDELSVRLRDKESELAQLAGANSTHRQDAQKRIEALMQQIDEMKRSHAEKQQSLEDVQMLKSQVTSLVGELNEAQNKLQAAETLKKNLQQRVHALEANHKRLQGEVEEQRQQHTLAVTRLTLQCHDSESALKAERQKSTEEKRKLAQLQAAYNQLFANYDELIKEMEHQKKMMPDPREAMRLHEQLHESEQALLDKQELIDKLKGAVARSEGQLDTMAVLKAQAEIFKLDFEAERTAREEMHCEKERLKEQLAAVRLDNERIKDELEAYTRGHLHDMQRRHTGHFMQDEREAAPLPQPLPMPNPPHVQPNQMQHTCPICNFNAPDMDTLQIHVLDCIQ